MPLWVYVFSAPLANPVTQVFAVAAALLTASDVVFGILYAISTGTFDSQKMRHGIYHKSASAGWFLVFDVLDALTTTANGDVAGVALSAGCGYLIVMELGSLMETLAKIDPSKNKLRNAVEPFLEKLGFGTAGEDQGEGGEQR